MEAFPVGGAFRATWHRVDFPGSTLVGVHVSDFTEIGTIVRLTRAVEVPRVAVIETVCRDVIEEAVATKVAEILPEGISTDDGTLNRELLAEMDTTVPADEAVDVKVTVHWVLERVTTVVGTQTSEDSVIEVDGCRVMVAGFETPP
jgi:hypothetical protein